MLPKHFIPALFWFLATVMLLCLPGSSIPKTPWLTLPHADKYVHVVLFFVLCFLFSRPFRLSGVGNRQRINYFRLILVSGIFYGTLMEFVQKYWIPNRSFDVWDIAADSVGCLLAFFASRGKFLQKG